MKKIDVLIVSTGRSASTAIYRYISEVGELKLPANKEPHFWVDIEKFGGIYPALRDIYTPDPQAYAQLYAQSILSLDASVGYFFYIDEVIEKLRRYQQNPKVIFLYREPHARMKSFFNELHKKNMTTFPRIEQDILKNTPLGQWWEYYYDNVLYASCFEKMRAYFDDMILVNYDFFAKNQALVIAQLLAFIGCEQKHFPVSFEPINSSRQAAYETGVNALKRFASLAKFVPNGIKAQIKQRMGRFELTKQLSAETIDLTAYLPNSLYEYDKFRSLINSEDFLCLKK